MRPSLGFDVVIKGATAPAAAVIVHGGTGLGQTHSAWHSPVPYLFGGLAAMLGLIAFALLILACSYWKLSGYLESGGDGEGDEARVGDMEKVAGEDYLKKQAFFEGIVVIMAGDEKPTFLAIPMSSRASSIGDHSSSSRSSNEKKVRGLDEEKRIDEVASISIPIEEEQHQLSQLEQDV